MHFRLERLADTTVLMLEKWWLGLISQTFIKLLLHRNSVNTILSEDLCLLEYDRLQTPVLFQ
jgi:hypothetical protein